MAKYKYHYDLVETLKEANGQSMPVRLIARHIYNKKVQLFAGNTSFEELYHSIRFYLWAQSNRPSSPFIKGETRGSYRIRKEIFTQYELDFDCDISICESEANDTSTAPDSSSLGVPLF